jgi:MEMO1 family protein
MSKKVKNIRQAAVAGRFYPEDPKKLTAMLQEFHGTTPERKKQTAIIAPHAGYIYSGKIAGDIYRVTEIPDTVVLLCPNHTGRGAMISVWAKGEWECPLGNVAVDEDLASQLLEKINMTEDQEAHEYEHAIEVHLPFLKYANPNVRIVPVVLGPLRVADCLKVGKVLAELNPSLLIASTDMSHYIPAAAAKKQDQFALTEIENLQPAGLYRAVETHEISMCGFIPTVAVLEAAKRLGAAHSHLISYGHSGERTRDFSSVVAYAGLAIA